MKKLICCLMLLMLLVLPAYAEEGREITDARLQPAVAISFDDGPTEFTQPILDILEQYGCRATFFMVGTNMNLRPEMVKAVYESGNEVGLHTWRHNDLTEMDMKAIVRNLELCQNIVTEQTGTRAIWLRPPYGKLGPATYGACREHGMYIATWSNDSRDWASQNAQKIYDTVLGQLQNGDIILFHDTHAETVEALPGILEEILNRGYQVLTVNELLSFRESLSSGTHYYHLDMSHLKPME